MKFLIAFLRMVFFMFVCFIACVIIGYIIAVAPIPNRGGPEGGDSVGRAMVFLFQVVPISLICGLVLGSIIEITIQVRSKNPPPPSRPLMPPPVNAPEVTNKNSH